MEYLSTGFLYIWAVLGCRKNVHISVPMLILSPLGEPKGAYGETGFPPVNRVGDTGAGLAASAEAATIYGFEVIALKK